MTAYTRSQPILFHIRHSKSTGTFYIILNHNCSQNYILSSIQASQYIWRQILPMCIQQLTSSQDNIPPEEAHVKSRSFQQAPVYIPTEIRLLPTPATTNSTLIFQLEERLNHKDCIFCCSVPSYGFSQYQDTNITPAFIPCYMVRNKTGGGATLSIAPTHTSTKTALNYLHSSEYDKIQLISDWISTGKWCHQNFQQVRQAPQIIEDPYQIAPFLHFTSPVVALHVNDTLLYGIVDTGCATLLCSRGYYRQQFPNSTLDPYTGNKYQQANADELPIDGVLPCSFQIGTLLTNENIPIFESPLSHQELLIGWVYLKQNNLTIGPNGIYKYPPSALEAIAPPPKQPALKCKNLTPCKTDREGISKVEPPLKRGKQTPHSQNMKGGPQNKICPNCRSQCQMTTDDTFICKCHKATNEQHIQHPTPQQTKPQQVTPSTFDVIAAEDVTILPKQQMLLKCRIQNLTEVDLQMFESTYMVFSSENTEPWQSLTKLSIFFQLLPVTSTDQIIHLVYFNDNPTSVFLYRNEIVGQCEPMQYAGDTECTALSKLNPGVFFAGAILQCPQTDLQSLKSPSCSHLELNLEENYELNEDDIHIRSDDPDIRSRMKKLLHQYQDIFGKSAWSVCSWGSTFEMDVRPSVTPHVAPRIPIPEKIKEQSRKIINILLQRGLIVPSKSPWRNSILFLVKKKNPNTPDNENENVPISRIRVVLDFRKTNESLLQTWTSQPLPLIEELLANMQQMKIISTADLSQGFFGCKLSVERGQQYTSFEYEGRLYQWTRLLQGARPSAQVFNSHVQRLLWDNKLHPEQRKDSNNRYTSGVTNYLDDLAICSVDQNSHFQILKELFEVLRKNRVRLKLLKSTWYITDKVDFLGFSLDIRLSTLQPSKPLIEKIINLKFPRTKRQIKSALGSFTFFHNLLPNFAEKLSPLFEVLQIDKPFTFGQKQKEAFQWAVSSLARLPMVYLLDLSKPIYGICDGAQHNSIAYCLLQYNSRLNSFVPCKWNSHRLNKSQMNYSQVHCETLSVSVYCSENYPLLLYRRSYLFNDSKCLSFLAKFRFQNVALYRLHLLISSCNLYFKWLPSSNSVVTLVDLLTRPPLKKDYQAPLVLKKKLTKELVDSLPFVNFDGMPELSYSQALDLLDSFHELCDKLGPENLQDKWQTLLHQAPLPPPAQQTALVQNAHINLYFDNRNNSIGGDPFVQYCSRINKFSNKYSYVQNVHNCTRDLSSMVFIEQPINDEVRYGAQRGSRKPARGREQDASPPGPTVAPLITRSKLSSFMQAEGKLHCFFPSFQLETLISEQLKDTKLMTSIKSHPKDYLQIKNVYCKKTQYKGIIYYPICWPSHLNKVLLEKSHIVHNLLHLRKDKLFSQLRPFFHIRGYNAAFENLNCKHCEQNLKARNPKIPYGITFNIKQCRSFISIDCCTVDSSMEYGSFLLCADICSYYLLAFQCKQNPTATEIYQLLFTGWVQTMGIPLAIQSDGGLSSQLAHDVASLFNIRQYFISPYNSKASRVELCHRYILENLKGAQQCGYLSEQSFGLWLSLATLLWNSSRTLDGASPSQLQFNGFTCRTHQFVTLANLEHQQSRSFLTQQAHEASTFLSMVCLRRKQLNLEKQGRLDKYDSNIHVGDVVLKQRMETKQARWKLKTKYHPSPYRVVVTRPHYCILIPLKASLEYISSPFLKGSKLKKKGIRVARMYLKKLKNPYAYLNLQKGVEYIEKAANLLGTSVPVKQIVLGPPLPASRTNHPFYKQFAQPPGYVNPQSNYSGYTESTQLGTQTDICFSEVPPFVSEIHSNRSRIDQFVGAVKTQLDKKYLMQQSLGVLKGNSKYIYILSKNYSWPRSMGPEVTCSYKYQTLYDHMRKQRLQNRMDYLRQITSTASGVVAGGQSSSVNRESTGRRRPNKQPPPDTRGQVHCHQDDPLENFDIASLDNYLDVCKHFHKSHIYPLVLSQIQNLHQDLLSVSSSNTTSCRQKVVGRKASTQASSSQSATTGSHSSFQSVESQNRISPAGHQDQDRISIDQQSTSEVLSNAPSTRKPNQGGSIHSFTSNQSSSASLRTLERRRFSDFSDDDLDQPGNGLSQIPVTPGVASADVEVDEGCDEPGVQVGRDHQVVHGHHHGRDLGGPRPQVQLRHPSQVPEMVDLSRKSKKDTRSMQTAPIPIPQISSPSLGFSREDQLLLRQPLSTTEAEVAASPVPPKTTKEPSKVKSRTSIRLKTRK